MNIYTLKNENDELVVAVDINEFLSTDNKEVELLEKLMRSSINRHFSTSFTKSEIQSELKEVLNFPLDASMYEFKIRYTSTLEIKMKSFHIPNENLPTSLNYN